MHCPPRPRHGPPHRLIVKAAAGEKGPQFALELVLRQVAEAVDLGRGGIPGGGVFVQRLDCRFDGVAVYTFLAQFVADGFGAARAKAAAVVQPIPGEFLIVQVAVVEQAGDRGGDHFVVKALVAQIALHLGAAARARAQKVQGALIGAFVLVVVAQRGDLGVAEVLPLGEVQGGVERDAKGKFAVDEDADAFLVVLLLLE